MRDTALDVVVQLDWPDFQTHFFWLDLSLSLSTMRVCIKMWRHSSTGCMTHGRYFFVLFRLNWNAKENQKRVQAQREQMNGSKIENCVGLVYIIYKSPEDFSATHQSRSKEKPKQHFPIMSEISSHSFSIKNRNLFFFFYFTCPSAYVNVARTGTTWVVD